MDGPLTHSSTSRTYKPTYIPTHMRAAISIPGHDKTVRVWGQADAWNAGSIFPFVLGVRERMGCEKAYMVLSIAASMNQHLCDSRYLFGFGCIPVTWAKGNGQVWGGFSFGVRAEVLGWGWDSSCEWFPSQPETQSWVTRRRPAPMRSPAQRPFASQGTPRWCMGLPPRPSKESSRGENAAPEVLVFVIYPVYILFHIIFVVYEHICTVTHVPGKL